jgi:DNA-binding HxlR family transcriptional regulator
MTSPFGAPTIDAMAAPDPDRSRMPLEAALDRVGDRWSLLLVEALLDGPQRFGALSEAVPGIAPNILTDRLRRLERERIVVATPYQQRPPRMSYALTADGRDLASALRLLADWGGRGAVDAEPLRHGPCGTALEARWYCPTCESAVEAHDAEESRTI